MRCGSCGWDNPAGIIFCTNCGKRMSDRAQPASAAVVTPPSGVTSGTPIAQGTQVYDSGNVSADAPVRCPRCAAPSQRGLRFCRECGAGLSSGPQQVVAAQAAPPSAAPASFGDLPGLPALPPPAPAAPAPSARDSSPGARDANACWRCQGARDPGAAFCRYCGASLGDVAAAPAPMASTPQALPLPAAAPSLAGSAPMMQGPSAVAATTGARLVTLLKDGSEGRSIPLRDGDADIGAQEGDITFPDDPYLSARHARLSCRGATYTLRDLDSVNGIYVRLRDPVELRDRDMVLIGQQVLRFELLQEGELPLGPAWQRGVLVFGTPEAPRFARLVQYTTEGVGRDVHYLFRDETVVGRENGDIVFTDDPFLSRRHAAIRVDHAGRRFTLHDLGSSNGTAIRIRGEHVLRDGDQFRIGRHLFRFEAGSAAGGRAGR